MVEKCPECGKFLRKEGQEIICPSCGWWNYDWEEICNSCPYYGSQWCPCPEWIENNPQSIEAQVMRRGGR